MRLVEHQRLATSGARTALPFRIDGALRLAVPQLSTDVAGERPYMNGGDSDVDALLYRWEAGRFVEDGGLPCSGGEDAHVFRIGGDTFLALASIRTGQGPYDMNAQSVIHRWTGAGWAPFQSHPTFAGRQWTSFTIGDRVFLAFAGGVTMPAPERRHLANSHVLEWTGERFEVFQVLDGLWGYGFEAFEIAGDTYLAYADHAAPSPLYRWDGERFAPVQAFGTLGGRAFRHFHRDGADWLLYAAIDGDSELYVWTGAAFERRQTLGGPGGREWALVPLGDDLYAVRVCFIEGTPAAPKTDLMSQVYRWEDGGFARLLDFPTFGGTDAEPFEVDGVHYLVVSNSLTADIRFRQDTVVYRMEP